MEIRDEAYRSGSFLISEEHYNTWRSQQPEIKPASSYKKVVASALIGDDPMFSTEPIIDVVGEAYQNMRRKRMQNHEEFSRRYMAIRDRYNFENKWREHYADNYRTDYTPKQNRRIRKQTNKWRRRYLGE